MEISDDVGRLPSGVHGSGPILGHVVAPAKQAAVRGLARASIEDAGARRELSSGSDDGRCDRAALDRGRANECSEVRRVRIVGHRAPNTKVPRVAAPRLKIALLGGVPASLGGGGLEVQVARTRAALVGRGHDVFRVEECPSARPFDVLHAFGAGPGIAAMLEHWRRCPAPLVVSPILVVAPGWLERRHLLASRLPLPAFGPRATRWVLRRADAIIALTDHERRFLRRFVGADAVTPVVVPNGAAGPEARQDAPAVLPDLPEGYVLLLGTVSARKRQADVIGTLGPEGIPVVVAGGFDGTEAERAAWERAVASAGARWLGEVRDPHAVAAIIRGARALVQLSAAEGQSLAVLEALEAGTPALLSRLPGQVELASRYPQHVRIVDRVADLPEAVASLREPLEPARVPTWDDVAAALETVYMRLVEGSR